ncbi:MAG: single-stranded DNA-binding protein [Prevotella sp.]|nr:single-stranded DNA-binding protein [Prevotella sp.]
MSFNKCIFIGNITADPELKTTNTGVSVCNFTLAVNRKFAKQGGQTVDFINICAWRASADFVGKYAKKGNSLVVCGQLQTRNYTNAQGQKVYVTEIVADEVSFAGNNNSQGNAPSNDNRVSAPNGNGYVTNAYGGGNQQNSFDDIPLDSSLPF